jgi:hypothetical protein
MKLHTTAWQIPSSAAGAGHISLAHNCTAMHVNMSLCAGFGYTVELPVHTLSIKPGLHVAAATGPVPGRQEYQPILI